MRIPLPARRFAFDIPAIPARQPVRPAL